MPLHIGIVGCSAEGAALCYRTICNEGALLLGPHGHPEVSMHTPSFAAYVDCLERDDLAGVAELMLASARKLAAAGADFLVCPDNTIHEAFARVEPRSPLPWLHIAEVVAAEASARGYRRVGLTGTRWLVDSDVYPDELAARGIQCVKPGPEARAEIGRIIMDELVRGTASPESVAYLLAVIREFQDQGCEAAVLGCTEIPLVVNDANSPLPTLDSTRLLARAALRRAVSAAPIRIVLDDLSGPEIAALIGEHLHNMHLLSPPESIHALGLDALRQPGITFWTAWEGRELVGCGALKELDPTHGEIKSMRTAVAHLRKGVASAMLRHILGEARRRSYRRVSLETGAAEAFVPARQMYARFGFMKCDPFGDYVPDPNSVFMTMEL